MLASMRRKGNCWDAPSESFFNSLKNERVHGTRYETRDAARADVFEYMAAPIAAKRCSRRMSSSGRPSDLALQMYAKAPGIPRGFCFWSRLRKSDMRAAAFRALGRWTTSTFV
jgi:hypothetical protein